MQIQTEALFSNCIQLEVLEGPKRCRASPSKEVVQDSIEISFVKSAPLLSYCCVPQMRFHYLIVVMNDRLKNKESDHSGEGN